MEEETEDNFIPFAKRSKMVSRCGSETRAAELPGNGNAQCYDDEFWNRLIQQPSIHWMEEYKTSPTLMSSVAVHRPDALSHKVSRQTFSGPERLPSPAQLCRRRKTKQRGQTCENSRVMSVCCHLEDLKRRQSTIDQLKRLQWGGYGTEPSSECLEEEDVTSSDLCVPEEMPSRESLSHLAKPRASAWHEGESGSLSNGQLIYPQWSPNVEETFLVPEERPMLSYVMATADRHNMQPLGCLSQESFWGFQNQPEE